MPWESTAQKAKKTSPKSFHRLGWEQEVRKMEKVRVFKWRRWNPRNGLLETTKVRIRVKGKWYRIMCSDHYYYPNRIWGHGFRGDIAPDLWDFKVLYSPDFINKRKTEGLVVGEATLLPLDAARFRKKV